MNKYNLREEFKIKRKGFSLNELAVYALIIVCFIAIVFSGFNNNQKQAIDSELLQSRAILIDRALGAWYQTHGGKYPPTLETLQAIELLPVGLPLNLYTYKVDTNLEKYRLSANLPSGGSYTSPGSNL